MEIRKVAVVGAGLMGSGITQVIAEAGFPVTWVDISTEQLNKGTEKIKSLLEKKVKKGLVDASYVDATLQNITITNELQDAYDVDLVIEAVPENLDLKKKVFKQLDETINENAILASNTSALSISAIGSVTKRPHKVVGTHFFYPVPVMGLLEVIPGLATSEEITNLALEFGEKIGKRPVLCNDFPGFIVNRLLVPMVNEAAYLVMEGVKPEDVDAAMQIGANHKMGPLTLADFVGIETLTATMEGLYEGFRDSKYRPCPLLVKMVEAGKLGVKSGSGFYEYDASGKKIAKGELVKQ
ncbi:3-hydroxyacyl-CoA dehydrogenase family protein [Ureibacillus manganicus]|uniref:3-hydroxybutyryl-CoA dehydrogenase n=1 Tax=Ureibacillus manganicus DSM 26584 TaxID=1384049 RepID=A0A0A3HYT2_9BACL|nr:3-hydroxyacyl-CoA dehydrogenase NAD-binding domain-containing protein [Ureibacillus manganicus]KGR77619.1 3-hydroxybutyryl-CoA dehydrogenase [Ureibacillus manganicus DSM 26584]